MKSRMRISLYAFDDTEHGYVPGVYARLQITEDDLQTFSEFLSRAAWILYPDPTPEAMFDEEFSYLESGVRSAAETAGILQGRVNIYINESKTEIFQK